MGEINKILANAEHKSASLSIELNDPTTEGGKKSVHIQGHGFRIEMDLKEFRAFAATVIDGYATLRSTKKLK